MTLLSCTIPVGPEVAGVAGGDDPDERAAMFAQFAVRYPHIVEMATAASHDEASSLLGWCDDQFEFEFGLDLILDGLEKRRLQCKNDLQRKGG